MKATYVWQLHCEQDTGITTENIILQVAMKNIYMSKRTCDPLWTVSLSAHWMTYLLSAPAADTGHRETPLTAREVPVTPAESCFTKVLDCPSDEEITCFLTTTVKCKSHHSKRTSSWMHLHQANIKMVLITATWRTLSSWEIFPVALNVNSREKLKPIKYFCADSARDNSDFFLFFFHLLSLSNCWKFVRVFLMN